GAVDGAGRRRSPPAAGADVPAGRAAAPAARGGGRHPRRPRPARGGRRAGADAELRPAVRAAGLGGGRPGPPADRRQQVLRRSVGAAA
ncbi:hypothetical protein E1289_37265, partial [Actinomadura sp. 6K520]